MMSLSKLLVFGIMLFSCSTSLFGMMQFDTEKVLSMTNVEEIDKFLESHVMPAGIATGVLCHLHQDASVPHEKVDILIKYAGQRELAFVFSRRDFSEDTYVVQQMKKKASSTVDQEKQSTEQDTQEQPVEPRGAMQTLADLRKEFRLDQHNEQEGRPFGPKPQLAQSKSAGVDKILDKVDQDASSIMKNLEKKSKRKQKIGIQFSYVKWGCIFAGMAGLVYYLYAHEDYKQINR
jgi:hypothetical protein